MPFIGTGHIWLIGIVLIIVLIIWGPGKLPEVGSGMGRAIREFRKASSETKAEFSRATAPEAPLEAAVATPLAPGAAAPAPVDTTPVLPIPRPLAEPAAIEGDPPAAKTTSPE